MAYIPDKAHDIIISYAHVDDVPRWQGEQGWVMAFEESLRRNLPRFLGRGERLTIWRDPKIRGVDFYDDVISKALKESALMISVMSKGYFDSTYCLDELRAFCETGVDVDFETGKKSRVFKVLLNDIPAEKQDERIRRTDGYRFFTSDQAAGGERIFRRTHEGAADQSYWNAIEKLAQDVAQVLIRMANRKPTVPAPPTGLSVYLAEVTDDLEDIRKKVKETLTQQGIQVLPELRLSTRSLELKKEIRGHLEQTVLSVHLMGQFAGKAADGDALPATQIQYELASEIGIARKMPRLVWLPPDLDITTLPEGSSQRTFLDSLRYEPESASQMELIQKSIEELKDAILKKVLPPPPKVSKFEVKRHALVYLAHHPDDEEAAKVIKNYLREARQDVMLTRGKDEKEQLKDLQARMRSCDAVLVLYGRSPVKWARDVTLKARGMAEKRRRNPLFAKSVCDGPPTEKEDLGFDFEGWPILSCREGIESHRLDSFIKAIAVEN